MSGALRWAVRLFLIGLMLKGGSSVLAQNIYDTLNPPPRFSPAPSSILLPAPGDPTFYGQPYVPATESLINTNYLARAAVFGDDGRLAGFAKGTFLPSAIPVQGQPFSGSDWRANLQGSGSAVRINGYVPASAGFYASAHAQFMLENAEFPVTDATGGTNVTVRQLFGRLNRLTLGLMDSAFSDPAALPETLDLAGPNARISVHDAGVGTGHGRLSYDFFSPTLDGFKVITSLEQPVPEISPPDDEETLARYPDFVCATQYVDGGMTEGGFVERWHMQFGSIIRDLGIESPTAARQNVFGWGTALSGSYRIPLNRNLSVMDRVMFSVTYGEGISHYITDLNAAEDTGDAVVETAGVLVPLPVFAWYGAYTHNWNDLLRSTITYSHVSLDSTLPLGTAISPYRTGDFVAVNLVRHSIFYASQEPDASKQNFFMGVEYLFGRKETLDGATGEAQRIMFVTAISK